MDLTKVIVVSAQFAAQHRWKNAPENSRISFLKNYHRHLFHVKCKWKVYHNDRDLEFFLQKELLQNYVKDNFENKYLDLSCEDIAEQILIALNCSFVSVYEDDENGSEIFV